MTNNEIAYLLGLQRLRFSQASSGIVLGRVESGTGPITELTMGVLLGALGLGVWYNALKDEDGLTFFTQNDSPIYAPGVTKDNPLVPTRFFNTVADMLAEDGWGWDRAVTLSWYSGDGITTHWVQAANPALSANGDSVLATDDGYGFALKVGAST